MTTTTTATPVGFLPQMITAQEAAAFLNVTSRTVLNWIHEDRIPYIELPGGSERAQYRIPLGALVSSLAGTYDLAAALADGQRRAVEAGLTGEVLKRATIETVAEG